MPQIEVTFDIDANGILNVSAKDKATGKSQSIEIKASSGLSDDEIQKMVKDAEAHAEDDRKFNELIEARNKGDSMLHAVEKSLKDFGDKVEESEKQGIEAAMEALRTALKGSDKEDIDAKTTALTEASTKLAEKAYADAGAQGGDAGPQPGAANAKDDGEDVVDAEFTEVKDDEKK